MTVEKNSERIIPLRLKLVGGITAPILLVSLFIAIYFPARFDAAANLAAERRAVGFVLVLANAIKPGLDFADIDSIRNNLQLLNAASDAMLAMVTEHDLTTIATWKRPNVTVSTLNRDTLEALTRFEAATYKIKFEPNRIVIAAPVVTDTGTRGNLVLAFARDDLLRESRRNRNAVLSVAIAVTVLGVLAGLLIGGFLVQPIIALTRVTARIVTNGDLRQTITVVSNDEVKVLTRSFGNMVDRLRSVVINLKQTAIGLVTVSTKLSTAATIAGDGVASLRTSAADTSLAIQRMNETQKEVSSSVDDLSSRTETASASIIQIASSNELVAKNAKEMAASADEVSQRIKSMADASTSIAGRLHELDETLARLSQSMVEIHRSIGAVDESAARTAQLAQQAEADAAEGVASLQRARKGNEQIRAVTAVVTNAMSRLSARLGNIDQILVVIQEVANQTNLLALNASITAAQAGEDGRGFSVVAGEIKTLAARTRASTAEIGLQVAEIKEDAASVLTAASESLVSAEAGVKLADQTNVALQKISESTRMANEMARAIAATTVRQTTQSQQVNKEVKDIARHLQEIARTSGQHAEGSEAVMVASNRMNELTRVVERSTQEQAHGSSQVISFIEQITERLAQVNESHRRQSAASEHIVGAVRSIERVAETQTTSVQDLSVAITALQREADRLRSDLDTFTV